MNPVFLDLGFMEIKWYSVLILAGLVIGYFLTVVESKRFHISKEYLFNLTFWAIIFGFIGARIYFVVFNWSYYSNNLIDILKIWEGGLAIHGGIIGGYLAILFYTKKYKMPTNRFLDLLVPALLLAQAIGRWGNFFNSEAHGAATTLESLKNLHIPQFIIEGMEINGTYYQPTFLYESLWCLLGFIVLLVVRRLKYTKNGQITYLYLMWYSVGRFFIEASRTDSLMLGNFKMAQLISIALFITGLIGTIVVNRRGTKLDNLYNEVGMEGEIRF